MDNPRPTKRSRELMLAALLSLAVALGVAAYYFDDLSDFVESLTTGKTGPAHGHIRY